MKYDKVMLKSRNYIGKPYHWAETTCTCTTMVFRNEVYEDFMLRVLSKLKLIFPEDIREAKEAIMAGKYFVERGTENYNKVLTVSFNDPNLDTSVDLQIAFHPYEDVVHVYKGYVNNSHVLIKNDKLMVLKEKDFHVLWECRKALVPTKWQLKYNPEYQKQQTITFGDIYNLYASRNPTIPLEEVH